MYKLPKFLCPNLKTELIELGKPNDRGYSLSEKDQVRLYSARV